MDINAIDSQIKSIAVLVALGWWIYQIRKWMQKTPEVPKAASEAVKTVAIHYIGEVAGKLLKK